MSRIGKQPIKVPADVKVQIQNRTVRVEGPKGTTLEWTHHRNMTVEYNEGEQVIHVRRPNNERLNRGLHGLTRSLIYNMIVGVTKGYEKRLKVEGIGYQARKDGKGVVLVVGFANSIVCIPPDGVTVDVPDASTIIVRGSDKQKVGQFAAEIRLKRPPEPYKGKGIIYEGEQVRRKEGKSFASGG
jgi:large subunit ribosomal protein L6